MSRWLLPLVTLCVCAATANAHHSIAGVYDRTKHTRIEGVVAEFRFVNPHPFVIVNGDDSSGRVEPWRLEMDNRVELVGIGMTADTFKRGDRIIASGSRAFDGSRSVYAWRIDRPSDGFWYEQVGSSPHVGRR